MSRDLPAATLRQAQRFAREPVETFETLEQLRERRHAGITRHGLEDYHDETFTDQPQEDPCED